MNEQELRLECLRLALGSMPIPGCPWPDFKSESVVQIATAYRDFLSGGKSEPSA